MTAAFLGHHGLPLEQRLKDLGCFRRSVDILTENSLRHRACYWLLEILFVVLDDKGGYGRGFTVSQVGIHMSFLMKYLPRIGI